MTRPQLIELEMRCAKERLTGLWVTMTEYQKLTGMSRSFIRNRAEMGIIESKTFEDNSVTYYKAKLN